MTTPVFAEQSRLLGMPPVRFSWSAALIIMSGALIAIGSLLPWFSLFAGLQPYRGVSGLYGQMVLSGGIAVVLGGLWMLLRDGRSVKWLLIASGVLLSGFTAWLFAGLLETYQDLLENPMYVARLEPGLFLAMAGALTLTLVAAFAISSSQRAARVR